MKFKSFGSLSAKINKISVLKKPFTIIITLLLISTNLLAQSPEKMSYQAVIRDSNNNLVTNQAVSMRISIIQASINGTIIYIETHSSTTNANGLVSIEIGAGNIMNGVFSTIDWSNGPYYINVETDPSGGANYTISGKTQLLSVPYALHSKTADTLIGTINEYDPVYNSSVASGITGTDTANWNNKLDSEIDPTIPTGTQSGEMQYWNGTAWITIPAGNEGQILIFNNGEPAWLTLVGANVLGNNDVYNPITGKVWMDRNLGASQVATSNTDTASYGDLYQWGRGTDGHEKRNSGTTTILSNSDTPSHDNFITNGSSPYDWRSPKNDNLWQGVNGTNNPCPSGYRLPTEAEWLSERQTWSSNDATGAFASLLKLPVAGRRSSYGLIVAVNFNGFYWSSTVYSANSQCLYFGNNTTMNSSSRAQGLSVRCIKD